MAKYFRPDDISGMLVNPPTEPQPDIGFRLGLLLSWNSVTRANSVDVGDAVFNNLSLLGASEAATLATGQTVGLLRVKTAYYIIGRLLIPT